MKLSERGETAFLWALRASCAVLAATLLLLVGAGDFSVHTYDLWRFAAELWRLPVGIMLLTSLAVAAAGEVE